MKTSLPHCDDLYLRYFDPWYSEAERKRKIFKATRPDLLSSKQLVAASPAEISPLGAKGQREARGRINAMIKAARGDWPKYLEVSGKINLSWITAFDNYYDAEHIRKVIDRSDPTDFANDYVIICCEFGAVLGNAMSSIEKRLAWLLESPYWESALFDSVTGKVIPVFHWAIKKMSGYGWNDDFTQKATACLRGLDGEKSGNILTH